MVKKLLVGLLILVIVLGPVGGFWAKPTSANTGPKILLCTAEPWHDEEWNKATPPPSSDQDSTYSFLSNSIQPKPQNLRQKPQKSFWLRLQFFLFNLKLLFEGK